MKALTVLIFFSSLNALGVDNYKYYSYSSYKVLEGLPPIIELTFQVPCNYELVKPVRIEESNEISAKATIALGGVFKENLLSSCAAKTIEVKTTAGHAYSGREHEIVPINGLSAKK